MNLRLWLSQFTGQEILYLPNPGNAGDSLIASATFRLFDDLGLHCQLFTQQRFRPGESLLFYGGGGNLIGPDSAARTFLGRYHAAARRLVVLPHTIRDNQDLLAELGANVTLIVRERSSLAHVQRHAPGAELLLADDLALSLDVPRFLATRQSALRALRDGQLPGRSLRRLLKAQLLHRRRIRPARTAPDAPTLHAFRRDREASDIPIPPDNFDLSRLFALGTANRVVCDLASRLLLETLARFERIRTNRLHVAIAGALLGRQVEFHANSYDKNEAVYRFSLAERFPTVRWLR